jgi:HD-GYP domain-containing protein (c-di-GMP phosphodiesterase class II)
MQRVILVSENDDVIDGLSRLFAGHFASQIKLVVVTSAEDATIKAMDESLDNAFVIVDVTHKTEAPEVIVDELNIIFSGRPYFFVGPDNFLKSRVTENLLNQKYTTLIKFPVELNDFTQKVKRALELAKMKNDEQNSQEMTLDDVIPVPTKNFYHNTLPYDVYSMTSQEEQKYLRLIRANESYHPSLIVRLLHKRERMLYVKKDEHVRFLEESAVRFLGVMSDHKNHLASIINAQVLSTALIHEYLRTIGVSENIKKLIEQVIEASIWVAKSGKNYSDVMKYFKLEKDLAERAVLVSYTVMFMMLSLGMRNEIALYKLGLASLLHDMFLTVDELTQIFDVNDPLLIMASDEDRESFLKHPIKASELANLFSGNFADTAFIIAQHHEAPKGKGFPHQLTSMELTQLSCHFILASNFVVCLSSKEVTRETAMKTLIEFNQVYTDGNFKDSIKALAMVLKT